MEHAYKIAAMFAQSKFYFVIKSLLSIIVAGRWAA
jgi:hypothetical protein